MKVKLKFRTYQSFNKIIGKHDVNDPKNFKGKRLSVAVNHVIDHKIHIIMRIFHFVPNLGKILRKVLAALNS